MKVCFQILMACTGLVVATETRAQDMFLNAEKAWAEQAYQKAEGLYREAAHAHVSSRMRKRAELRLKALLERNDEAYKVLALLERHRSQKNLKSSDASWLKAWANAHPHRTLSAEVLRALSKPHSRAMDVVDAGLENQIFMLRKNEGMLRGLMALLLSVLLAGWWRGLKYKIRSLFFAVSMMLACVCIPVAMVAFYLPYFSGVNLWYAAILWVSLCACVALYFLPKLVRFPLLLVINLVQVLVCFFLWVEVSSV